MIAIVDSGSTKSDWIIVDNKGEQLPNKIRTKGLNPAILNSEELLGIINESVELSSLKNKVEAVYFYGAGCGTEVPRLALKEVLQSYFKNAKVFVKEDTYAAVYATITNNEPAIVCILGTGSNCTYYDGEKVQQKIVSLGYSVMDLASGNYYGRELLRAYFFNTMPKHLSKAFAEKFDLNADTIKYNLYKKANPNAYLASFAAFLFDYNNDAFISELIKSGFTLFAKHMIFQFKDEINKGTPVHFAGSIAFLAQNEIKEIAKQLNFKTGSFVKRPIDGLVTYHAK